MLSEAVIGVGGSSWLVHPPTPIAADMNNTVEATAVKETRTKTVLSADPKIFFLPRLVLRERENALSRRRTHRITRDGIGHVRVERV
jgi:hypothetical protein